MLAIVMSELIALNQITFIIGRLISDNIALAEELVWGFQQKGTPLRACISLDLNKVFYSISWNVL